MTSRSSLLVALTLMLGSVGCSKESSKGSEPVVEALPKDEIERGHKACDTYVERVCTCAQVHADMADECALAKARPEALQLNLDLMSAAGLSQVEAQAVKIEARKIIAGCFEDDGRLEDAKCPRVSH